MIPLKSKATITKSGFKLTNSSAVTVNASIFSIGSSDSENESIPTRRFSPPSVWIISVCVVDNETTLCSVLDSVEFVHIVINAARISILYFISSFLTTRKD